MSPGRTAIVWLVGALVVAGGLAYSAFPAVASLYRVFSHTMVIGSSGDTVSIKEGDAATIVAAVFGGLLTAMLGVAGAYFAAVRATEIATKEADRISRRADCHQVGLLQRQVLADLFVRAQNDLFDLATDAARTTDVLILRTPRGTDSNIDFVPLNELVLTCERAVGVMLGARSLVANHEAIDRGVKALRNTSEIARLHHHGGRPGHVSLAGVEDPKELLERYVAERYSKSDDMRFAGRVILEEVAPFDSLHEAAKRRAMQEHLDHETAQWGPAFNAAQSFADMLRLLGVWLSQHALLATETEPQASQDGLLRMQASPEFSQELVSMFSSAERGWRPIRVWA